MIAPRSEGLCRMAAFVPHMADDYAALRNYDLGARSTVSRLSPYLRRRLVTKAEVINAAKTGHGPEPAARFIDEVIWRSYSKGCASIWIFVLWLPWRLGADFFLRHLVDGDPASITLGWLWVAGLHTGQDLSRRGGQYRHFHQGPPDPGCRTNCAPLFGTDRTTGRADAHCSGPGRGTRPCQAIIAADHRRRLLSGTLMKKNIPQYLTKSGLLAPLDPKEGI